ncbi:MAG: NAD-dependent epimerase/dehydratase family protein [Pirellulales bacterium]|nr:NAD-dependent epimerase/dehydratase family protein [Pirellulales bacterium]
MPSALVTGASGFIGNHLVRLLQSRGYDVTCLLRNAAKRTIPGLEVRTIEGDITDAQSLPAAVSNADVVFHVAGAVKARGFAEFLRVNAHGTKNLAAACADRAAPPVFVLVSSVSVVGPSPDDEPLSESAPCRPVSQYSRSKREGERVITRYAGRLPVSVVRPGLVFGEGDSNMFKMLAPVARWRLHGVPTRSNRRLSFVHVSDVVDVIWRAAERGQRIRDDSEVDPTGWYFATADEMPTYAEFGQMAAQALGYGWVLTPRVPEAIVWTGAAVIEGATRLAGQSTIMGLDKMRDSAAGSWLFSNAAAKRDLDYRPQAPLVERLRQTYAWYRQQGWL